MLKREEVERIKEKYQKGTPIRLYSMEGEHTVPPGSRGVVDMNCGPSTLQIFCIADRPGSRCGPSTVQIFCIADRLGSRCGPSAVKISANVQSQQNFILAQFYVSWTIRP